MDQNATTAPSRGPYKSKTLATWVTLLGGPLGLHRFYLYGTNDLWGWLHPLPTLVGIWGVNRAMDLGQDDQLSWLLIPVLGFMVAATMLQAIVYGLMPDDKWHARFNPSLVGQSDKAAVLPASGWGAVIGVIAALLIGATVLLSTITYSLQRYFELQAEQAQTSRQP